jgi:hypothetical protein
VTISIRRKDGKLTLSVTLGTEGETLVTHITRLIRLRDDGFEFEAAMAMAAIVEGLAGVYLATLADTGMLRGATLKEAKRPRLTFGQVTTCLHSAGALKVPRLAKLATFVKDRNLIVHNLVLSVKPFNFVAFFDRGNKFAMALTHGIFGAIVEMLEE